MIVVHIFFIVLILLVNKDKIIDANFVDFQLTLD